LSECRTVAITPAKAQVEPWDEVVRVCQTCAIAGMKAMVESREGKPFRFMYMSGLSGERDQTKKPWLMGPYSLLRVCALLT